jgi:hypothetical protein
MLIPLSLGPYAPPTDGGSDADPAAATACVQRNATTAGAAVRKRVDSSESEMLSDWNLTRLGRIVSCGSKRALEKMLLANAVPVASLRAILASWFDSRPVFESFLTNFSRVLGQTALTDLLLSRLTDVDKGKLELIDGFVTKAFPKLNAAQGDGAIQQISMARVMCMFVIGASWIPPFIANTAATMLTETNAIVLREIISRGAEKTFDTVLLVADISDYDFGMILDVFDHHFGARKLVWSRFVDLLEWRTEGPKKDFFVAVWIKFQNDATLTTKRDMLARYTQDAFAEKGGYIKLSTFLTALLIGATWKSAPPEVALPPRAAAPATAAPAVAPAAVRPRNGTASGRFTAVDADLLTMRNESKMGQVFKSGADAAIRYMREVNAIPNEELKLILRNLQHNPKLRVHWTDYFELLPEVSVQSAILKKRRGEVDAWKEQLIHDYIHRAFPDTRGESPPEQKKRAKTLILTAVLLGVTQRAPWFDDPGVRMDGQPAAPPPPSAPPPPGTIKLRRTNNTHICMAYARVRRLRIHM